MPPVPRAVQDYARDAAGAFRRAPAEVALGLLVAVAFSVSLRRHEEEEWLRLAAPAALALPLVFGLSVLHARRAVGAGARWGATALVLLSAAAYGAWVFDPERASEGWRFAALLGAAVTAVPLAAVPGGAGGEARRGRFWCFTALLLTRIVTVVLYGAALFAALAGAVAAVSALFELKTPEHLYGDLAGAVFFALVPWVVVGGIPEMAEISAGAGEGGGEAPRVIRLVGRYLYAPVLLVYLAILLAYTLKVLATGDAPKNLLSPIILLAGLGGFLGSILLEPLRRDPEHTGVARLVRVFPAALLALLPLAVWAVWVRRGQYGWTEFRYLRFALLLALAVLAVLGTVRLFRRREPLLVTVPLVLCATLLLAAFGPWGASAVSRRSQLHRLRSGLEEARLLRGGKVARALADPTQVPRRDPLLLPEELHDRITGSLTYLYDAHGPGVVQPFFAEDVARTGSGWSLTSFLELQKGCDAEADRSLAAQAVEGQGFPGLEGGTLYILQWQDTTTARFASGGGAVTVKLDTEAIRVAVGAGAGAWEARADLRPLLARMRGSARSGCTGEPGVLRAAEVTLGPGESVLDLVDAEGRRRGQVALGRIIHDVPGPPPEGATTAGSAGFTSWSGAVVVFPEPAGR
ncbi:MAG TPA: DUF4153 domain-containing protein [Longimicrobiaceae bacterium]